MVYSSHFVMCVLVDGKPLKERADGIVQIPVNSEYTIRFKNKNSRRAMVKFTIDGENASGNGYVINAHSDIEIKRFSDRDQMFKFVDLDSAEAQLEGKNGPNTDGSKGVIEAKFQLEKQYVASVPVPMPVPYPVPYPVPQPYPYPPPYPWRRPYEKIWLSDNTNVLDGSWSTGGSVTRNRDACGGGTMSCSIPCSAGAKSAETYTVNPMTEGVTVGGHASGQTFVSVHFDAETEYTTLRLVLRGVKETEKVQEVAEDTEYCRNCGTKKSRKSDKFCGRCGSKF